VLVAWHARVEDRIAWLDALRLVNERAIARVERDWSRLPAADVPSEIAGSRAAAHVVLRKRGQS